MSRKTVIYAPKPASSMTTQAQSSIFRREVDKQAENPLQPTIWQPRVPGTGTATPRSPINPGHNFANVSVLAPASRPIQAKLTVGEANDNYEQEADRIADTVMRIPEPALQGRPANSDDEEKQEKIQTKPLAEHITPLIQRQTFVEADDTAPLQTQPIIQRQAPENGEAEEETAQAKSTGLKTPAIKSAQEDYINRARGQGQPLPDGEREYFEPRFGHHFGRIRVHADGRAANAARHIQAQAFTVGHNIFFGANRYQPGTQTGRQLLAHELTHTVQQTGVRPPANLTRAARSPSHPPLSWNRHGARRITAQQISSPGINQVVQGMRLLARNRQNGREERALRVQRQAEAKREDRGPQTGLAQDIAAAEQKLLGERVALLPPELRAALLATNLNVGFAAGFLQSFGSKIALSELQAFVEGLMAPGNLLAFYFGQQGGIVIGAGEGLYLNIKGLVVDLPSLLFEAFERLPRRYQLAALSGPLAPGIISSLLAQELATMDPPVRAALLDSLTHTGNEIAQGMAAFVAYLESNPSALLVEGEELGQLVGGIAVEWLRDEVLADGSYLEKGTAIGRIIGLIAVEIALLFLGPEIVIARGGAAAGRYGTKLAARSLEGSRFGARILAIIEKIPGLDRIVKAVRGAEPAAGDIASTAVIGAKGSGTRAAEGRMRGHADAREIEDGVVAKQKTLDGAHEIKVTKDGQLTLCSDCKKLRDEYAGELAENPQLNAELARIEGLRDPAVKAQEAVKLRQQLDNARVLGEVPNASTMLGGVVPDKNGFTRFVGNIDEHIIYRDFSVKRRRGIGGAHNRDEFFKYSNEFKLENTIPHPTLDGVEKIQYRIPAIGSTGKPTGGYLSEVFEKTVYDPSKISNKQYLEWGRQAAAEAQAAGKLNREWVGTAPNGLQFREYLDQTGAVKSFFPEF